MTANLDRFIETFWGYGNWRSPIWFIGLEEAGCDSIEDLKHRLKVWEELGAPDLLDCRESHLQLAQSYQKNPNKNASLRGRFEGAIKTQAAWARLICLYLAYKSEEDQITASGIKEFQRNRLHDLTLIEFMPLPVASTRKWPYEKLKPTNHDTKDSLSSRAIYRETFGPKRANALKAKIVRHKPDIVVIYGRSSLPALLGIPHSAATRTSWPIMKKIGTTTIIIVPHPTARGFNSYKHWIDFGFFIKKRTKSK